MTFSWHNFALNLRGHAPALLTAGTVAGVVSTAYLAHRSGYKSAFSVRNEEDSRQEVLTNREKFALTWQNYIPPIVVGGLTIAAAISSNHISAKRAAALAGAVSLSEAAFREYKDKVIEQIGKNKAMAVQDAVVQDHIQKNPFEDNTRIIFTDGGDMLCYDMLTDRYFQSTAEKLRKAQNDINQTIINGVYASLNDWYRIIGLPTLDDGDDRGWSTDNLVEIVFSSGLTPEESGRRRPYLAVIHDHKPLPNYMSPW